MKTAYYLGLDVAKHKVRAALRGPDSRFLFERDLPVNAAGRNELLVLLAAHLPAPDQVLALLEATGVLHLHWAAALSRAGYPVLVLNPLLARRLYTVKNSIRENKTDPVDARGLCAIGALHGEELRAKYRFVPHPEKLTLQRLQSVRKALRQALTNLKKTYGSLRPELPGTGRPHGNGRDRSARTPGRNAHAGRSGARARRHLGKRLEAATQSGPALRSGQRFHRRSRPGPSQRPALQAILRSLATLETQLRALDQQIDQCTLEHAAPARLALLQTIPGVGPLLAAKVSAYLPEELLQAGNRRTAATRLQAFMGNDPRLQESGQWQGHVKMSKRGVETLRTAFFQAAFSASQHDPELHAFYQRKRSEGKKHEVALSHLMRILTRRLVAVLRSQQPYKPKEVFFEKAA
ncbi:MAG: IS110 family transposase [Chthoniobacterales bacterium]